MKHSYCSVWTVFVVSRLDDFLEPLHHGVWEVVVSKDSVTESLDPGWEKSPINVPSPGTIASYRKGQYHVHEAATEWRVHLDNHDPKKHPFLHLVDDAPLLLMIGDTFVTLIAGTRKQTGDEGEILEGQKRAWQDQVLVGFFIILLGLFVITNPLLTFQGIIKLFIPLVIIGLGLFTVQKGVGMRPFRITSDNLVTRGLIIVFIGFVAFYIPIVVWLALLLGILALWMIASAVVLLARARKGRGAIPEGFFSRVIIAIVSLILAGLIIVDPMSVVALLMVILGFVALALGIMLVVNGLRLRKRMKAGKSSPQKAVTA
jgi:uncharacterized membrane protein HdeD (DUF308 family)